MRPGRQWPYTLFQAASKPIAALAALVLVHQGALSLDEDVNAKLRSWKLPTTADWPAQATLRHPALPRRRVKVRSSPATRPG
jgi:CubicO group peptidase (beta-lactamase class C family)